MFNSSLVWIFLSSDVNWDNLKFYGNLVRCNGLRGKARTATCGTVLGVFESRGDTQIFHFVNIRQVLGERLSGPLSSFRYNLNVKVDPVPFVISDKKQIIHSLLKIPINVISNKSSEFMIRTVHCNDSHVEIDYVHVKEHEPIQDISVVGPSPNENVSIGTNKVAEAGPSNHAHSSVEEEQHDEAVSYVTRCSPNTYPELGCANYDQFLIEMQPPNVVQSETLNTADCADNSQEGMESSQFHEDIQMDVVAGSSGQSQNYMEMPSVGVNADSVRVPPFEESKNVRTTSVITSVPKNVVILQDEVAAPGYFHQGDKQIF